MLNFVTEYVVDERGDFATYSRGLSGACRRLLDRFPNGNETRANSRPWVLGVCFQNETQNESVEQVESCEIQSFAGSPTCESPCEDAAKADADSGHGLYMRAYAEAKAAWGDVFRPRGL